jgi:membrane fusion protein (multidrug efflux system)
MVREPMNPTLRRVTLVLLPVALLIGAAAWWKSSRSVPSTAALTAAPPAAATARPGASSALATPAPLELRDSDLVALRELPLQRSLVFTGSLRPLQSGWVKAKVAGELTQLTPREGDALRAGDLVGRIDASEFEMRLRQAQQQAAAARAQREVTRRQLENNRALVGQGFISATALDTALANDNAAQATADAAQAAVDLAQKALGDTQLKAPLTGQVAQRLVQPGERVAVDARVMEIVDLSRLEIEAALPASEAAALKVGAMARLEVEGQSAALQARVARINPSAQAGTRAVLAYLSLPGGPGLRSGLFARGEMVLEERRVPALPLSAVRTDAAQPYVLVFEGSRLQQRRVELGLRGRVAGPPNGSPHSGPTGADEEAVEIRSGLDAGALVLQGRLGSVRDGQPVRRLATNALPAAPAALR